MRVKEFRTKYNEVDIIPLGDVHIGDKNFTKESEQKLKGYINWIKNNPKAYCILMGDILNCATRGSKSSPFDQNMDLKDQISKAVELFKPIKDKILGAIEGNHEARLGDFAGFSPMISVCDRLGIDYMGNSGIYIIRAGCHGKRNTCRESFVVFAHHTAGGNGKTPGSKLNKVDALRGVICNADVICGAHNHMLGCVPMLTQMVNVQNGKVEMVRQMLVDCGSFLQWDGSYAERLALCPQKLGAPKIKLIINRHEKQGIETTNKDVHVSL